MRDQRSNRQRWGQLAVASPGALLLLFLFAVPLGVVLYYSLIDGLPIRGEAVKPTLENYAAIQRQDFIWRSMRRTGSYAAIATAISFVTAYPVAYYLARKTIRGPVLLFVLLIPFWTSTVLRVLAWRIILGTGGVAPSLISLFGFSETRLLPSPLATVLGLVYIYTPFMVLPLYAVLGKVPPALLEASHDLGAGSFTTLRRVVMPLTRAGMFTAIILVLMSAFGDVLASEYLGGSRDLMTGTVIYELFIQGANWNVGSAAAVALFAILLLIAYLLHRAGGGGRWKVEAS